MGKKTFDDSKLAVKLPPKPEVIKKKEEDDVEETVEKIHAPGKAKPEKPKKYRTTVDMEEPLFEALEKHLEKLESNGGTFTKKAFIIRLVKKEIGYKG